MKTYLLMGFLLGVSLSLSAQNRTYAPAVARAYGTDLFAANDPEDKDISIMTGILSKLVQQEFNNGDTAINIERIKGSYIPGSGILFTINQRVPFYSRPMILGVNGRAYAPGRYGLTTTGQAADVLVVETPKPAPRAKTKTPEKTLSIAGQQPIYGVLTPSPIAISGDSVQLAFGEPGLLQTWSTNGAVAMYTNPRGSSAKIQDSVFAAKIPRMKKVLEKFLAEYTILLSKLKPEEKIWVTWTVKEDYWGIDQGRMACELSSRIVKQDMLDLRAGKLDQTKFAEKVQYSVTRCAERVTNPEVEVFTAILERLYSPNVSQNLVQFGAVQAEVVGGFGYVFKMNFSPARIDSLFEVNPNTYATQLKVKGISKEDLDQRIKTFKVEFPQQLLEYSRVLKGLKTGEILKIDVSIGEFAHLWRNAAEGGKQFSFTLPQSLIRDFDTGKLKLEDAVKLIQMEEK